MMAHKTLLYFAFPTALLVFGLMFSMSAFASDPASCTATGVALSMEALRADGTTPIGAGTVTAGELIKFRATLTYPGLPNCNYVNGTLMITTPDSITTDVTPVGGVPLVSNVTPFSSSLVSYIVNKNNVSGNILVANAVYANGTSLLGGGITPVGAQAPTPVFFLPESLIVTKTAQPTINSSVNWSITKTVSPASWTFIYGDSGDSQYNVTVTKNEGNTTYAASGVINITNPAQFATATIDNVTDVIDGGISGTVSCGVSFPYNLTPGSSLVCTYTATLPDNTTRLNNATAQTTGDVGPSSGTAAIDFSQAASSVTQSNVTVVDTNGESWNFSESGSQVYTRTFDCANDNATYPNTATIVETGASASANVTVQCYQPFTDKNATTAFDRTFNWNITKSVSNSSLVLAVGVPYVVNYTVTVNPTTVDTNFLATGLIIVRNPSSANITVTSLSDVISGGIPATVDCGTTFPAQIAPGAALTCVYNATLPDNTTRVNNATAIIQNTHYGTDGIGTPNGTSSASGIATIDFASANMTLTDDTVSVNDSFAGFLGNATAASSFTYNRTLNYSTCGNSTVVNTATFVTDDTTTSGSANATVTTTIPCAGGCTLTQGYWKTHSAAGPAPYDDTWLQIVPNSSNTTFYYSGQTYLQVLQTAPKGGNAYYQLAHQYIAAQLNMLNNASVTPQVASAFANATTLFNNSANTPTTVGTLKGNSPLRAQFNALAGILGSYNEGGIGPGHCEG